MCIARFLYSYLDDLLKNLGKTSAQECKKFTLGYPLDKSDYPTDLCVRKTNCAIQW